MLELTGKKAQNSLALQERWGYRFALGSFGTGILWGSTAFVIAPENSTPLMMLILLCIAGLAMATAVTYASYAAASYSFTIAAILPWIGKLLSSEIPVYNSIGILVGVYFVIYVFTIIKSTKISLNVIATQSENRHLIKQLKKEKLVALDAEKKALRASNVKSTFLANMSHEIRTPMNAIIGLTHLLQQGALTADQAQQLTKIDTSAGHLLSIINNILDISKIEAGKLVLEQADFQLDSVFEHLQSMFMEQLDSRRLTIEIDRGEVPPWLRGDRTRLCQALLNYLGNAIKFTEHGTISLRAIKLEEGDSGILVRFEVRDTGIGIAAGKLSGLFESFQQADTSTTRIHGGTGLGLAITRRLAKLMGGEAGVESELGSGSTFWFTARLEAGHGEMPDAASAESAVTGLLPHHQGARVLLVEDNAINLEVAEALLSRAGLEVDTAEKWS